jgi:hypothetical protein
MYAGRQDEEIALNKTKLKSRLSIILCSTKPRKKLSRTRILRGIRFYDSIRMTNTVILVHWDSRQREMDRMIYAAHHSRSLVPSFFELTAGRICREEST